MSNLDTAELKVAQLERQLDAMLQRAKIPASLLDQASSLLSRLPSQIASRARADAGPREIALRSRSRHRRTTTDSAAQLSARFGRHLRRA